MARRKASAVALSLGGMKVAGARREGGTTQQSEKVKRGGVGEASERVRWSQPGWEGVERIRAPRGRVFQRGCGGLVRVGASDSSARPSYINSDTV
jgi:hypothetical protein